METITLDHIYGYLTIQKTQRVEGNDIILGGITRRYTRDGQLLQTIEQDNIRVHNAKEHI